MNYGFINGVLFLDLEKAFDTSNIDTVRPFFWGGRREAQRSVMTSVKASLGKLVEWPSLKPDWNLVRIWFFFK